MTKNEKIILPAELYDKLDVEEGAARPDVITVEAIDNAKDSFILRAQTARRVRDYAPRWFLVPTAVATAIFALLAFTIVPRQALPMSGGARSIATGVLVVANATAFVTFVMAYIARRRELYQAMRRRVYWRTFPTVLAAYLIIVTLGLTAFFWFIDQIFHGLAFDKWTSIMIFAVLAGILNYVVIFLVDNFSITMLINMLILVVAGGLVAAMATNGNQYWWRRNFSLLGTSQSHASWQFNLTLVVSAALFVALIDYVFVSLAEKYGTNPRHITLRVLLTLTALSIAGVGLVPNNGLGLAHHLHDQISMLIVFFMGLAILGVRWLLPQATRNFVRMSYGIVGILAATYVLWHLVHYLTLTAFEILSFSLSFAWLMLFINSLMRLLWDERRLYQVVRRDDEG